MANTLQAGLSGLAFGPLAYLMAGRRRRAAVGAVVEGVALLGFAYAHYLAIFVQVDPGGTTARDLTDTAIAATRALVATAGLWAPVSVAALVAVHAVVACDMARLARKRPAPVEAPLTS